MRASTTRDSMAKERSKRRRAKVERSSGNVFADLFIPDAEELKTKVQLAVVIKREIAARGWSQAEAAEVLGINQPKVSALLRYRLDGFSVERLMNFLTALGHDVEIVVRPRRAGQQAGRIVIGAV